MHAMSELSFIILRIYIVIPEKNYTKVPSGTILYRPNNGPENVLIKESWPSGPGFFNFILKVIAAQVYGFHLSVDICTERPQNNYHSSQSYRDPPRSHPLAKPIHG